MTELFDELIERNRMDPFLQGIDAASTRGSFWDCPYERKTAPYEFEQWFRGFNVTRRKQIEEALKASRRRIGIDSRHC